MNSHGVGVCSRQLSFRSVSRAHKSVCGCGSSGSILMEVLAALRARRGLFGACQGRMRSAWHPPGHRVSEGKARAELRQQSGTTHGSHTPAACSFPGANARSWAGRGEARPGQSTRCRAWRGGGSGQGFMKPQWRSVLVEGVGVKVGLMPSRDVAPP